MKKQYFFGHFFVRAAKGFVVLVILIAIGLCLLQYSQAKGAARAVAYQPSLQLERALSRLKDAFSATASIVSSFNSSNQSATPPFSAPGFLGSINSDADFARIGDELAIVDQERQELKKSILRRFETLVGQIEEKLRAYGASLHSLPSPTPASSPVSIATPSPSPAVGQEALFSSKLGAKEIKERSANLAGGKEFLKALETKAENADNRAILSEAAGQLDALSKLLPQKFQTAAPTQQGSSTPSSEPRSDQGPKVFLSERVAGQLDQLRNEVRQTLLTPWTFDEAFEQAADLTSVERDKCREATLAQKGIWLSAASKILIVLLAAALLSLLILVFADLVRTLLDTATNIGIIAGAIPALRGLAKPASQDESPLSLEATMTRRGGIDTDALP